MKYMDEGLKGWINSTARSNFWKVCSWYDLSDLIQDGYMVYAKCLKGFQEDPTNPKDEARRFMAYFKMAYNNHIRDLAMDKTTTLDDSFSSLATEREEEEGGSTYDVPEPESISTYMALKQAPKEVLEVLAVLVEDAQSVGGYIRSKLRKKETSNGSVRLYKAHTALRETNQEYYERVIGRPDAFELIQSYLKSV